MTYYMDFLETIRIKQCIIRISSKCTGRRHSCTVRGADYDQDIFSKLQTPRTSSKIRTHRNQKRTKRAKGGGLGMSSLN